MTESDSEATGCPDGHYAYHRRYTASVEPLFGGMCRGVLRMRGECSMRVVCVTSGMRGAEARTRIYTRCAYQHHSAFDTDTRVTIIEKKRARFVSSTMGRGLRIECRWLPPIAAVTLELTVGCPFALDQLPAGSFIGFATRKLDIRAEAKSRGPVDLRYRSKTQAINKPVG